MGAPEKHGEKCWCLTDVWPVCALPGGNWLDIVQQEGETQKEGRAMRLKDASKPATGALGRQLDLQSSLHMHRVRGSCSDHYNKDSY